MLFAVTSKKRIRQKQIEISTEFVVRVTQQKTESEVERLFVDDNILIVIHHSSIMPPPRRRLSGLQKDVLSLYRTILRASVAKDRAMTAEQSTTPPSFLDLLQSNSSSSSTTSTTTCSYAKTEFRKQAQLVEKKYDFKTIEHKIR